MATIIGQSFGTKSYRDLPVVCGGVQDPSWFNNCGRAELVCAALCSEHGEKAIQSKCSKATWDDSQDSNYDCTCGTPSTPLLPAPLMGPYPGGHAVMTAAGKTFTCINEYPLDPEDAWRFPTVFCSEYCRSIGKVAPPGNQIRTTDQKHNTGLDGPLKMMDTHRIDDCSCQAPPPSPPSPPPPPQAAPSGTSSIEQIFSAALTTAMRSKGVTDSEIASLQSELSRDACVKVVSALTSLTGGSAAAYYGTCGAFHKRDGSKWCRMPSAFVSFYSKLNVKLHDEYCSFNVDQCCPVDVGMAAGVAIGCAVALAGAITGICFCCKCCCFKPKPAAASAGQSVGQPAVALAMMPATREGSSPSLAMAGGSIAKDGRTSVINPLNSEP